MNIILYSFSTSIFNGVLVKLYHYHLHIFIRCYFDHYHLHIFIQYEVVVKLYHHENILNNISNGASFVYASEKLLNLMMLIVTV